jgi:diacylglycerol kinase (ATP)
MPDKVIYSSTSSPSRPVVQRSVPRREHSFQIAQNLLVSFQYAGAGLKIAITLGISLQLSPAELALIGLTIGLVMTLELLNTSIEAVVDLVVDTQYHELAKIAKDCAAGAVLMSTIAAIGVAGCLLLPPLWDLLAWGRF